MTLLDTNGNPVQPVDPDDPRPLVDPDFAGSIFEQLGLVADLCPRCRSHLKADSYGRLICLNACHLTPAQAERFAALMRASIPSTGQES